MLTKNRFYTVGMAGLVLEAQKGGNGAAIRLAQPTGEKNQEWKLINSPDKSCCKLVNAETKLVIDVALGGTENGAWLHQWEDANVMTQEWTAQPTEDGLYKLLSRASGRCMDAGLVVEEGTALKLWDDVDGASQKWDIQEARKSGKTEEEKPVETPKAEVEKVADTTTKKEEAKKEAEVSVPEVEEKQTVALVEKEEPVQKEAPQADAEKVTEAPKEDVLQVTETLVEAVVEKSTPAKKNNRKKSRKNRR